MYYRGDEFSGPEPVFDEQYAEKSILPYANTPDSAIRAQELATGREVAESGFFGGGGFLKELGETLSTFALFFSPFAPVLLPAIAATPILGSTVAGIQKIGGALRPTIEAITTGPEATTTGRGATSFPPSPGESETSLALQRISSQLQQQQSAISSLTLGPSGESRRWERGFPALPPPARRSSRATRASQRLSATSRKILLREALRQALR